ncbi:MAG: hypothetical protein JNJ58_14000 [Chitinophagaceae bacterium]|nr:hypothetical protein [Chitinophagaceae bacterium]
MNLTHLHLLLNHFPIIGTLIGGTILLWGIIRKQIHIQQLGSLIVLVMAILAIPVFLTGEPAEESVEHLAGISERMIHEHEEAAEFAIWVMEAAGLLALISFIVKWDKIHFIVLLVTVLSFVAMARTGYLGGQIRHTELNTSMSGGGSGLDPAAGSEENEKEDD